MRVDFEKRYASFGGIEKMFESYKKGIITLSKISSKINKTSTTVSNDLKSFFGADALENARVSIRRATLKSRRIKNINLALSVEEMKYGEASSFIKNGKIEKKGNIRHFENLIEIAKPIVGKPSRVWFASHSLSRIEGLKGIIRVRYGKSNKETPEYKIKRYRFKITPEQAHDFSTFIFCITDDQNSTYYAIPAMELHNIKSLNLKFEDHNKSHKYSNYLVKVVKKLS